jgi:hypothetical protein
MISIKVFGKTCSGAKNSRIGNTLSGKKNQKCFRTPWGSCYSNEMFTNDFINMELDLGGVEVGGFIEK